VVQATEGHLRVRAAYLPSTDRLFLVVAGDLPD
jgi:hypothetical protein